MKNSNSSPNILKNPFFISIGILLFASLVSMSSAQKTLAVVQKSNLAIKAKPVQVLYTLPQLPYSYEALEPHFDKQTMEIHYSKHHRAYVDNLNKALVSLDANLVEKSKTLESIFENMKKFPDVVRNNAGGHYNHTFFWNAIKPGGGGVPIGNLANAINATFGSFDEFKKQFTEASTKRFGSGWAWLVVNDNKLVIGSTANQDNPLMKLKCINIKGQPILALDLWEHAYYLKNQNRRADYIQSFWNVVDWQRAEMLFNDKKLGKR